MPIRRIPVTEAEADEAQRRALVSVGVRVFVTSRLIDRARARRSGRH